MPCEESKRDSHQSMSGESVKKKRGFTQLEKGVGEQSGGAHFTLSYKDQMAPSIGKGTRVHEQNLGDEKKGKELKGRTGEKSPSEDVNFV